LKIRLYFWKAPTFLKSANILEIRQYFGNPPIFWESANIFEIRQYFGNPSIFSKSAYFSARRQYFMDLLDFVDANIVQYIFSVFIYAFKYVPIFRGTIVLTL
jgi:hypothetical protein